MWPFFRPNFENVDNYRRDINDKCRTCDGASPAEVQRILAFIPTGWADSSNYNRRNATVEKIGITIQLIPYSEHSQYNELLEFVKYIKPREVVPTVYSDVSYHH